MAGCLVKSFLRIWFVKTEDGPTTASRWFQTGAKTPEGGPKKPQGRHKRAPRGPQLGPREEEETRTIWQRI